MAGSIPDAERFDAEIAELLHTVHRHLRTEARRRLEPLGVTPAQLRALRTIDRAREPMRMSALADHLGIARRSATTFVDQLVDTGLVERSADGRDRRSVTVAPTAAGRRLLATIRRRRTEAAGSLLGALDLDERRQLAGLLRRISPGARPDSPADERA